MHAWVVFEMELELRLDKLEDEELLSDELLTEELLTEELLVIDDELATDDELERTLLDELELGADEPPPLLPAA